MANTSLGIENIGALSPDFGEKHIRGYPNIAHYKANAPQTGHLRGFPALSWRFLLYDHADLEDMEKGLLEAELEDSRTPEGKNYAIDWIQLKNSAKGNRKQITLVNNARKKLKEFQKSVLLHRAMYPGRINESQLKAFQRYFDDEKKCDRSLIGAEAANWGTSLQSSVVATDLFALHPEPEQTLISRFLIDFVIPRLRRRMPFKSRAHDQEDFYDLDGNSLVSAGRILVLIVTVVVNLLCLVSLCNCETTARRLLAAALWFLGFAVCVIVSIGDTVSITLITVITGFMAVVAPLIMGGPNNGVAKNHS